MRRSLIALFFTTGCGGPAEPAVVAPPAILIDAGIPDAPVVQATVIDAASPEPDAFRARQTSTFVEAKASHVAWSNDAVVTCSSELWCKNDCFLAGGNKGIARAVRPDARPVLLPFTAKADPSTVSASADCNVVSFRVPSSSDVAYETWDSSRKLLLRTSHSWPVAGGAFDAQIVPSGTFLRWRYSRGSDRYEEIKSGVKGPDLGLHTSMSPDERFVFVGGGVPFAVDKDTPAELLRAKDGKRIYGVPKKADAWVEGVFCATGNLLATIEPDRIALRRTDDPKVLATLAHATEAVFSPDGTQIATFDRDSRTVRVYRLERCRDSECAPIRDCSPRPSP